MTIATGVAAPGSSGTEAARYDLAIVTGGGQRFDFQVEIADTEAERRQGLMFRERLGEGRGMLFLYPGTREAAIWMKNTLLPLDILFIDAGGRVVKIEHDAVPLSDKTLRSGTPVRAVLEIDAGVAHSSGISAGDRILYEPLWPDAAAR